MEIGRAGWCNWLHRETLLFLFEGHRWVDSRRFNRLALLPLDKPTHFRANVQPVAQAECLIRVKATTPVALQGPGCP